MISTSNRISWSIPELLLVWLERGCPTVRSDYRTVSKLFMVVEILTTLFRISNYGYTVCPKGQVKIYLLIPLARKHSKTLQRWLFLH